MSVQDNTSRLGYTYGNGVVTTSHDGSTIGGFRRLSIIGTGAQGRVWKAECVEDVHGIVPVGTIVALKIKYAHGENMDEEWSKLEERISGLVRLNHPNIVRYLGCFREQGIDHERHVVVQELLSGLTLREKLDEINKWNPKRVRLGLDADEALRVVREVASALGYSAKQGIYHRDVKPGNIFLCDDGTAKLIDFGVAKQGDGTITGEGNIRGSWNYLAPDFADGEFRGDEKSDFFSVGVVFHEMLTGVLPYVSTRGDDMTAYFSRWAGKAGDDGSPLRISGVAKRILTGTDKVLDAALARERSERFHGFAAFSKALEGVGFIEQKHAGRTYRRLQFIGEGGFGEVFKARWLEENVLVAVKMLRDQNGAERFRSEAAIIRELRDPCFVRFIDFFEDDDHAFLVMNFLDGMPGSSLRDAINRAMVGAKASGGNGGLPKELVLSAFERYARGLALLHRHSPPIIHRDIKPSNLYYPREHPERVAIMDFGIVRSDDSSTVSGIAPCTFDYAPPEIALTEDRGGPGMDIFALGLCMYEALTGKTGYPRVSGDNAGMLRFLERCKSGQPPEFDDPGVVGDPDLLGLLRRMTDPDVTKRLVDADRVAFEIRKLFYRDIEDDDPETMVFDPKTDNTVAIDANKLREWFECWRKTHPVDDKRLMELYRQEWSRRSESRSRAAESPKDTVPAKGRWIAVLLAFLLGIMLAGIGTFAVWQFAPELVVKVKALLGVEEFHEDSNEESQGKMLVEETPPVQGKGTEPVHFDAPSDKPQIPGIAQEWESADEQVSEQAPNFESVPEPVDEPLPTPEPVVEPLPMPEPVDEQLPMPEPVDEQLPTPKHDPLPEPEQEPLLVPNQESNVADQGGIAPEPVSGGVNPSLDCSIETPMQEPDFQDAFDEGVDALMGRTTNALGNKSQEKNDAAQTGEMLPSLVDDSPGSHNTAQQDAVTSLKPEPQLVCPLPEFKPGSNVELVLPGGVMMKLVWCTGGFWIGATEVTQREWGTFMETNKSVHSGDALPVENVTIGECREFLAKLSDYTDKNFSLPTPKQWMAACLAGVSTSYSWGDSCYAPDGDLGGNFVADGMDADETMEVRSFGPNKWGIYDMHGNVAEWCDDGSVRGGGFASSSEDCRAGSNTKPGKGFRNGNTGFRVCLVDENRKESK